jgi:hypothetical protein
MPLAIRAQPHASVTLIGPLHWSIIGPHTHAVAASTAAARVA